VEALLEESKKQWQEFLNILKERAPDDRDSAPSEFSSYAFDNQTRNLLQRLVGDCRTC